MSVEVFRSSVASAICYRDGQTVNGLSSEEWDRAVGSRTLSRLP